MIRNFIIYSEGTGVKCVNVFKISLFHLVFTIFIFVQNKGQNKTQVKLITVTYWIKLLLVTEAQCMVYSLMCVRIATY